MKINNGRRLTKMIAVFIVLALSLGTLLILPPSNGKIPEFLDKEGNPVQGSISEKQKIEVDGENLGLILLGKSVQNPVLLVCGGGPGIPQYLLEELYPSRLADEFIVCYWDYRGTGLSYSAEQNAENMTTERYVSDALTIAEYLSERFSQDKIYIMGHSFGTYVALKTVQQFPDRFRAYLAMSQICDQKESEILAFNFMKKQYEKNGNTQMVRRFEDYNIGESENDYQAYFRSGLRDKAMHDLGVGTTRDMHSVITGLFFPSLRCKAYTPTERINIWRSKAISRQFPVTNDAISFDAFSFTERLNIPVFFLIGKYDCTCCASLQEAYCESIDAPDKEAFLFENSAHSPIYEEPAKAQKILQRIKART